MAPVYELKIRDGRLRALIDATRTPYGDPTLQAALGRGVQKWGALVQARAVRNVTGYPVVYDGQVFRVQVRTGTLRGSIELQYPYGSFLRARVYVNGTHTATSVQGGRSRTQSVADYAAAIEEGHAEIDLKQFMLGKVVPFFGAKSARARGPYAARGLEPTDPTETGYGSRWTSQELNARLQAKGKGPMTFEKKGGNAAYQGAKQGASTYFIAYRRVGKTGWVIPEAKPRPFMRAALESTQDQGRRLMVREVAPALDPRNR